MKKKNRTRAKTKSTPPLEKKKRKSVQGKKNAAVPVSGGKKTHRSTGIRESGRGNAPNCRRVMGRYWKKLRKDREGPVMCPKMGKRQEKPRRTKGGRRGLGGGRPDRGIVSG